MPKAALVLKKNLGCTASTSTAAKDIDTPPPLGDSEESAVQHSPGEVVKPEVGQRREKDGEISAVVRGKESGNVLDEDPPSGPNKFISASGELVEQSAALSGEAGSLAGDGEVLAGEASAEEVDGRDGLLGGEDIGSAGAAFSSDKANIGEDTSVWEAVLKYTPSPGVPLGLEDDSHPGSFEAEVEASDSAEQGSDCEGVIAQGFSVVGSLDRRPRA